MRFRARALLIAAGIATAATLLPAARPLRAQQQAATGRIVGRVIDAASGAGLTDVGIQVVGTTIGTASGVDGRYVLAGVPAGTVTLHVRRIGFQPKTVTGLVLEAGRTVEQDVSLSTATVTLSATVVSAAAEKGSVSKALDEQRSAAAIVNSTTAEQIARSPDGNAAQAVQRVSGVTVQDGKYVFVRGLGERYTTTSLNGARLPSPEPEKKVVPLDLFPASLIEAVTTSKTFTPDQPGDFSGASVNIRTREFPADRIFSLSTSVGYNTVATGQAMLQPPTVGTEWLGYAGGARALPSAVAAAGNLGGVAPGAPTNALIGSFRNAWSPNRGTGAPNTGFGMTFGGEDPVLGHRVGYVASTSYSYSQSLNAGERYVLPKADGRGDAEALSSYRGESGRASVLWGGMLNLSTWLGAKTRVSLDNSYNRSADNEARQRTGTDEQYATTFRKTRLSLVERNVIANQLRAERVFGARHTVSALVSRAEVTRAEPDRADLVYWMENGRLAWTGAANDASRSFGALRERDASASLDYKLALGETQASAVKVGAYVRQVRRRSDLRTYDIVNNRLDLDQRAIDPENLFRGYAVGADSNLLIVNSTFGGRYNASEAVEAGYAMVDLPFASRFRVIGGARIEHSDLRVRSFSPQGAEVESGPVTTDLLPSVSLSWALTGAQNLRLSATQTLSRPEYRELSPIAYADEGGDNELRGNPGLERALIRNYDLRWEWYPDPAEVLSVSLFGKQFEDPIERVYQATTGKPTIGFTNARGATNYGVEVDVRKGLGFLGDRAEAFSLFANGTVMRSRIQIRDSLSAATNPDRAMVGQAPYVVNAGLTYATASGAASATVLYNVVGERIVLAGIQPLPDTYEQSRQLLDVSLQVPVWTGLSAKLNAKNLLDAPYVERTGSLVRRRYTSGRSFSVGLTWRP